MINTQNSAIFRYKAHIKNSYLTNQTKIDKGQLFLQKGTDESRLSNTMVFTCIQSRAKLQGPWRSIDSVLPTGWYMGQLVLGFMMLWNLNGAFIFLLLPSF